MKQVLDKQKVQGTGSLSSSEASTSKLESLTRESNVVYLDFAKKQVDELQKLNRTMVEGLSDKGELAKTLKEIKSTFKSGAITEKVMGLQPKGKPGDIAGPTGLKDFFTLRGFLDKTNILKRGNNTGIGKFLDKKLETREQKGLQAEAEKKDYSERKQQYVSDRMATKGSTFGNEKSFAKTFDESEKLQKEVVNNEAAIKGLQDRGFKEGQIKRGGLYKNKEELESKLAKTDSRFSDSFDGVKQADPKKPKTVKAADDTDKNSTKKRSSDVKPIKVELTDSKIKADPDKPKITKAADVDDPNSTKKRAKTVKKAANEDDILPSNVIKFPGKNKQSSGLGSADLTEADIEKQKADDAQTKLLQDIADNTASLKKPIGNKPEPPKDGTGMGLGTIGTILAGIVGTLVGLASAWVKTIKLFAKALIPTELMEKITKGFSAVDDFFSSIFSKFKALFDFSGESKIGKIFGTIKEALSGFIKPFVTAYEVISDLLKGPIKMVGGVFTAIKEYFTMFANSVGKIAIIAEKIFFPILIIMTIWDTVKGAIEGFEKEGIIGGIKGAITGFFNSLIFGPIDMLKDAIAWVLGFFGFDKAKTLLESFSLEDIFKKFIDAIFSPIQMIKDMFAKLVGFFDNIEIPAIGFSAFGKEFKAGPWYPFKKDAAKSSNDTKSEPIKPGNSDAKGGQGSSQQAANDPRRVDKASPDVKPNTAAKKVTNQDMSKSSISPEEAKNILESGSKRDIESFGGAEKLKQIISVGAAPASAGAAKMAAPEPPTGKLGLWDRMKVQLGFAKPTDLAKLKPADEPQTGNKVASQSADSEMAKNVKPIASNTVIAPTSNNSTNNSSTYAIKPPVRNPEEGLRRQLGQRYGT